MDAYGRRNLPSTYTVHEEVELRFKQASLEIDNFRQKVTKTLKKESIEYIKNEGVKVFWKEVTSKGFCLTSLFLAKYPHLKLFSLFKAQVDYALCFSANTSSFDIFKTRLQEMNEQVLDLIGEDRVANIVQDLPDPSFLVVKWAMNELGLNHTSYFFNMTVVNGEVGLVNAVIQPVSCAIVHYRYENQKRFGVIIKPMALFYKLGPIEALYAWLSSFLLFNLKEEPILINPMQDISAKEVERRKSAVNDTFEFLYRELLCAQFRNPHYARRVGALEGKLLRASHLKKLAGCHDMPQ